MLGISGIYDLNAMVAYHDAATPVYRRFTSGAFGTDEEEWKLASPTDLRGMPAWIAAKVVGIAHSEDDGLVEMQQVELMQDALKKVKGNWLRAPGAEKERSDFYVPLVGPHDSMWQLGTMAPAFVKMLEELVKD